MMRMKQFISACVGFAATAILVGSAQAQTQEVCFTDSIPLTSTNWSDSVTIPKFDPMLGDLQSIRFTLTGNAQGTASAESLDTSPTVVTLQFSSTLTLTRPDNSVIVISIPLANFMDTFTAFDGTIDFAGTSGASHTGINATQSEVVNSPPPASDLVLFTGPGTITLPVTAVGSSIATGSGNLISQFLQQAAATVEVCYTYLPNTPPFFTEPTCNVTLPATAGVPITFNVCAADSDPNDVVTITSGALPPGATMTPPLPVSGNPICSTFDWTPGVADIGAYTITFTATDTHGRTATCQVNLIVAECFQLVGRGGGGSQIFLGNTLYNTHIANVRLAFAVTMTDRPTIVVPMIPTGQFSFSVQTLMHNADMFPTNPDQWSQRLRVTVQAGGIVTGELLDDWNGIHQNLEVFTDPNGVLRMGFPFTIDGM
jgi:hypothetical protein